MKRIFGGVALLMVAVSLAGCTVSGPLVSSGGHGSRSKLYSSIAEVASDSSMVVVGSVRSQNLESSPAADQLPHTLSIFVVSESIPLAGQAQSNLAEAGAEIRVRQNGLAVEGSTSSFLALDEEYLLFLTPSMLRGDDSGDYYITGGTAGLWHRGGDGNFTQMANEGDELPKSLTVETLPNALVPAGDAPAS